MKQARLSRSLFLAGRSQREAETVLRNSMEDLMESHFKYIYEDSMNFDCDMEILTNGATKFR